MASWSLWKDADVDRLFHIIASSTSETDDEQLSFSYTGSVYPTQKEALRLIPFFRLHDSRYAIYFHQVSEAEVESIRQEMERKERKAMELANQTADIISPESNNRNPIMASGTNRRNRNRQRPSFPTRQRLVRLHSENKQGSKPAYDHYTKERSDEGCNPSQQRETDCRPHNQRSGSRGLRNTLLSFAPEVRRR